MFRSTRRRLFAALALVVCLGGVSAPPASANRGPKPALSRQQRLTAWLAASATNPTFQDGFCGEVVNGEFLLNATGPGRVSALCTVKAGTPIVGLAGLTVGWGSTPAGALADRGPNPAGITDPTARLDGRQLRLDFARTAAFKGRLEPGSFIRTVDPAFADADRAWIASVGWTVRITKLPKGNHTLVLASNIDGAPAVFTYRITVK